MYSIILNWHSVKINAPIILRFYHRRYYQGATSSVVGKKNTANWECTLIP